MKKISYLFVLATTLFIIHLSLTKVSHAVQFDANDRKIDLPQLTTANNAISPRIDSDNSGHAYIVYSDNRGGPYKIYVSTKFGDNGWAPRAVPITTGFPKAQGAIQDGDATLPQVCSDEAGHVYVVWVDDRAVKSGTGKKDIYFRYSKDYGTTWYAPDQFTDYRIDSDNPSTGDSRNPRIACNENGEVFIAWEDDRNQPGIYEAYFRSLQVQFSRPVDFIVPYQTPEVRINTGQTAGLFHALRPAISIDNNGNVYAAWQDTRLVPDQEINPGIYFNVSHNKGITWNPDSTRIDSAKPGNIEFHPPVISNDDSGHVYVAWLDNAGRVERGNEFAADSLQDVYFNVSDDHGATFAGEDRRIDVPVQKINAKDIDIANDEKGNVYIVWASNLYHEDVSGLSAIYNIFLNRSENYGRSFMPGNLNWRVDNVEQGTTEASRPKVKADDFGNVYVVWVDKRTTKSDMFFNFSINKGKDGSWQTVDYQIDKGTPPGNSYEPVMSVDSTGHVYIAWQDDRSAIVEGNFNIYAIGGFLDIEKILLSGQRLGEACFIATAAYGSPFEKHVVLLREFRDKFLLTNRYGGWFVETYYRLSPPAAQFISGHPYLKPAVRVVLWPLVGFAAIALKTTLLQKILLAISAATALFLPVILNLFQDLKR